MTPVQDDLIRVSVKIFCVGFLVGLALALFVLCDWVHAADAGSRCQNLTNESARCDGTESPIVISPCLDTMETAMRAMEPYLRPDLHAEEFYDGCNYCSNGGCTALACPLGGNEVARLEWELKRAKQKEEAEKQRIAALAQWELGKACWGKP